MQTDVTKKLFTVDEYYRMAEAGIFDEDSRVELIEGEIIEMSPVGNRHVACVDRANSLFVTRLEGKAIVSIQNPIRLSNYTEPQPDIVVLKPRVDYYASKRHSPEDTLLVIEVSDTTLRYDRNRKAPLYAKSGVSELWIENLENDVILVFRDPGPETFATLLTFHRGESISMQAFPEIVLQVDDFLGERNP